MLQLYVCEEYASRSQNHEYCPLPSLPPPHLPFFALINIVLGKSQGWCNHPSYACRFSLVIATMVLCSQCFVVHDGEPPHSSINATRPLSMPLRLTPKHVNVRPALYSCMDTIWEGHCRKSYNRNCTM